MKHKLKLLLPIVIVIISGIIAGLSLLHEGLPPTHDGEYHVIRFYEFDKVLKEGDLYPRWAPDLNNGYGIPLFNYVYPLPNYVSSILHLFRVSFIDAFKLNMFLAIIVGSVFFYLWTKEFWGKLGGVVSSVFYTFSPYHFVDIYIRGSVGEVWALAFFPAFLWAYTRFVRSREKLFLILSSIFLALIIFSHNILALMFFIFSLSYVILLICKEKNKIYLILNTFYIILLGLGLSAIFWLPAIYDTKYVTGLQIFDVASHFPQLYQLLIPSWGSGFSGAGLQNELSFQIGVANLFAVFLSLIVAVKQIIKRNRKSIYASFFITWFIFISYLMLSASLPLWRVVPLMRYFQFPWRLLSVEILFASFLAGSVFSLGINKWIRILLAVFLVLLTFMLGIGYTKPAYYHNRDDDYYISRSNFIDGTNSPGNVFNTIWFNKNLKKKKEKIEIDNGSLESSIVKSTTQRHYLSIISDSDATINTTYFPGWIVSIDGKETATKPNINGLISFVVPKGSHSIGVKFEDTFVRKVANLIFTASIFSMLFYSIRRYNSSCIKSAIQFKK